MISHQYKVIFIHIPKCAGRSISRALQQDFDHYTASYYQTHFQECWHNYTVFTTVRNPYQRLVSMYHYIKKEPVHAAHPITNRGNMMPFKEWILENITAFQNEFAYSSAEGNRETDGQTGSPFWFSSQVRRLSDVSDNINSNIHILRYEEGIPAVSEFLYQTKSIRLNIEHLNSSHSNSHNNYLNYYDTDLLKMINSFPPFAKDCKALNYHPIVSG